MFKKISLVVMILAIVLIPNVFGVDYSVKSYNINAKILENGDMEVTELIRYSFDEDMNGLYRDILYSYIYKGQKDDMNASSKRYQASGISDIKAYVSDTSFRFVKEAKLMPESMLKNGMDGYYSIENTRSEKSVARVKVYSPAEYGKSKYVKYTYTIKDVVVNYEDYAEIYWNFIGGDWECSLSDIVITLTLPEETKITAYAHTFGNINEFDNDGKTITCKISRLSSSVAADIRAVFPNDIMDKDRISKQKNEKYDFSALEKIEEELAKNIKKNRIYNVNFIFLVIISVITEFIVIIKNSKSRKDIIKKYKKAEIFTDILDKDSLIGYSKMQSPHSSSVSGEVINATIMDLTYKKVIKMDARKEISGHKDKYKYMISMNKDAKFDNLTDYEKIILNYLFLQKCSDVISSNIEDYKEFELNERFKSLANKTSLASSIRTRIGKIDTEEKKAKYNGAPAKKYKRVLVTTLVLAIIFVINIFAFAPSDYITGRMITILVIMSVQILLLIALTASFGVELKEEYIEENNRLMGLKRYLKEYSLLKERYPIEIVLWDKYMVFACLFGIADKVAKEFKEELITRGLSEDDINRNYAYIYMGNHISSFNSSVSSATYAGTSGSSSSGGFHGGGGGGRRWRWRRCLLKLDCYNSVTINKIYDKIQNSSEKIIYVA